MIDLHKVGNASLTSFARNIGMQHIPIFLQDTIGFFLIEIQHHSGVIYLDAIIEVMDDVWFLGFVDSVGASLIICHLRTLFISTCIITDGSHQEEPLRIKVLIFI